MSNETEPVLQIRDLRYAYKKHQALNGVTFEVERRSIHGFVGPNGAGKTTTLKIIATLARPLGGSVRVFGHDVVRAYKEVRKRIGFMPDHFSMYRQMTVFEYLDFFAAAYGLQLAERNRTIKDVLTLTDMAGRQNDLIKGLSRGMQQRVSLARVLVHDPDLLLLDEPASGLDPRARIELMEILKELSRMGKTVFISSHILSELADLCDSVTIVDRGRVKFSGPISGLLSKGDETLSYVLDLREESVAVEEALRGMEGVANVSRIEGKPSYQIAINGDVVALNSIIQRVIESGGNVAGLSEDRRQLNQVFMDLTEAGVRE